MDDPQSPMVMTQLPTSETVTSVGAGCFHGACAMSSGKVFAWGCNGNNELGQVNTFTGDLRDTFYTQPVGVEDIGTGPLTQVLVGHRRHVVLVSCGAAHTAAVDREGRVLTWGCRDGGRLGRRQSQWPPEEMDEDQKGSRRSGASPNRRAGHRPAKWTASGTRRCASAWASSAGPGTPCCSASRERGPPKSSSPWKGRRSLPRRRRAGSPWREEATARASGRPHEDARQWAAAPCRPLDGVARGRTPRGAPPKAGRGGRASRARRRARRRW